MKIVVLYSTSKIQVTRKKRGHCHCLQDRTHAVKVQVTGFEGNIKLRVKLSQCSSTVNAQIQLDGLAKTKPF